MHLYIPLPNDTFINFHEANQEANRHKPQNVFSIQVDSLSTIKRAPCNVEFCKYSSTTSRTRIIFFDSFKTPST